MSYSVAQDAVSVLNRYVQVTGGADVYRKYKEVHVYSTVTKPDKMTENLAFVHSRNGKTLIERDFGSGTADSGVTEGVAWKFTEGKPAQILTGKLAARLIAEAKGFDEDDWVVRYPKVRLLANESIHGVPCRHVSLTRTDGSMLDRFYEVKSGLLVRETGSGFDDSGNEQQTSIDMETYDEFAGIRRPTVLHVKQGSLALEVHIDSVTYSTIINAPDFELPRQVARAILDSQAKPGGLPNPADLLDRFVEATGGRSAYDAIKSEVIKAEVSYTSEKLKFALLSYAAGNREYTSYDVPSLGKFEAGDDGQIAWEKSVMSGVSLSLHGTGTRFMGPGPSEVMTWWDAALTMETVSQDNASGAPCYLVRMGPKEVNPPSACFDVKTGLLSKIIASGPDGESEQLFSDYRNVNGLNICHRIETKIDGHAATVEIKQVDINAPLPPGVFDLPSDVQTLKARHAH